MPDRLSLVRDCFIVSGLRPRGLGITVNLLDRILQALFWLPIVLCGLIGFGFIEPRLYRVGIVSLGLLSVFVVLAFLQVVTSRKPRALQKQDAVESSND